jgi:signal peptidase I
LAAATTRKTTFQPLAGFATTAAFAEETMQANIDTPRQGSNRWWIVLGLAIIVVALAAVFFTIPQDIASIKRPFRSFSFPSTSMEPTLRLGEYAFADMRAYNDAPPARGDIVVFTLPRDPATTYVKRVVGLPGDQVQMKNGIVYINGQAVPAADAGTYKLAANGEPEKSGRLKRETLPNGVSYTILDLVDNGFLDNTAPYPVPVDHYFMLGDNRDNSSDSRVLAQVGYIPRANVIGRIGMIFWSPDLSRIGTMPK